MPTGPLATVDAVIGTVLRVQPKRILDLGIGSGKWGYLLRDQTDFANARTSRDEWDLVIDGVEGYGPYVGPHQQAVYNTICVADVSEFLHDYKGSSYDVILACDIIEHFTASNAIDVAGNALKHSTFLVLTTPKRFAAQRWDLNPLEDHKSWWPRTALKDLARRVGARISIAQTSTTNIAVLSETTVPPKIKDDRLVEVGSMLRDRLVPELLYYRVRGKTGPTLQRGHCG